MIGKLVAISLLFIGFVAYAGINAVPYYQDLAKVRDDIQPIGDGIIEKALNASGHLDIRDRIAGMRGSI